MTQLGSLGTDQIVFPKLGLEFTIKSVAFTLFGIEVTWYGVLITLGMLLAMIYGFSRMRKFGVDADRAMDGVIAGVIGGVVGARFYYVACRWSEYGGNWKEILNIRNGGLAIYGGVIGALLIGGVVCKLRKVRLLPMLDLAALGFLIGQGIGRWGNFTNHEAFGRNTDSLFGMSSGKIQIWILNNASADSGLVYHQPVHPCFFYESLWCLAGFVLLHIISKKWRKFDGQIFLMYIVWYGFGRFWIEGLRTDSLWIGTIRISQLVAAISVVVGIVLLCVMFSYVKRMGGDYVLYCNTVESQKLLAEADAKEEAYRQKRASKKAAKTTDVSEETTHVLMSAEEAAELSADTESEPAAEQSDSQETTADITETEVSSETEGSDNTEKE